MKKPVKKGIPPSTNITPSESVTQFRAEADRIEGNPEAMLNLVDLIFGFEPDRWPVS